MNRNTKLESQSTEATMIGRRFKFITAAVLLSFAVLLLFHTESFKNFEKINQNLCRENLREAIYRDLNDRFTLLETRFYQTIISFPSDYSSYRQRLKKTFDDVEQTISLLHRGGLFRIETPLILPLQKEMQKKIQIPPSFFKEDDLDKLDADFEILRKLYRRLDRELKRSLPGAATGKRLYSEKERIVFTKELDRIFRSFREKLDDILSIHRQKIEEIRHRLKRFHRFVSNLEWGGLLFLGVIIIFESMLYFRELRKLNRQLLKLTEEDSVTGLPTRFFMQKHYRLGPDSCGALFKIHGLEKFVSLFGADFGEKILRVLTQKVQKKLFQPHCILFRYDSNIFGIFDPFYNDTKDEKGTITKRVKKIHQLFEEETHVIDAVPVHLRITLGAATGENCISHAYIALQEALDKHQDSQIYTDDRYRKKLSQIFEWERKISHALKHDGIVPFRQPIVDAEGTVVHNEILMRLKEESPNGEILYHPPHFLDLAKRIGQYEALSRRIIAKAFESCSFLRYFSINIGIEEIQSLKMWTILEELILRHEAQHRVIFEILEHEHFTDYDQVSKFVTHFKELGVRIAIDDFGSGYSSFRRMLALRPDYLKIDGSIIRSLENDGHSRKLLEMIVRFAHSIEIQTVAEFVENEAIFRIAEEAGVDLFQGYYFSKPEICPKENSALQNRTKESLQ